MGGVLVEEMNNLEVQFLFKIDFSLQVLPEVFEKYNAELISHSNTLGLERIAHGTDEELFRVPQAQDSLNGNCHHSGAVEAAPQAPLLQTYSQSELEYSSVYPPPTPYPPQDESLAAHYSVDVLMQQQQQLGMALDSVYPFLAIASQANTHRQAPSEQDLTEIDMLYRYAMPVAAAKHDVALSQYTAPFQAIYNGLTHSQGSDLDPVYSSPAVPTDGSYSYYYPTQVTASGQAPSYSQHRNYINSNGTILQATTRDMAQNHHHPEITPSPPPHRPMSIHGVPVTYHTGQVGCSMNHLHSFPYLKQSSSSSSAASASLLHDHYYATPADAALAMHHQQQLMPSRPIAIGNHHLVPHENHWACRLSVERSASASGST